MIDSAKAPHRVCLLRLSAIGDTCHALAALRALQASWPQTRFTWIIGRVEAKLMSALAPEVEFITFDKRSTVAELARLRRTLATERFDLLLHMQLALRASLASALVRASRKLGYDRARARELQWAFTNERIAPAAREHVLDALLGFVRACGIAPPPPSWRIVLPPAARAYADALVGDGRPTLVISPCSSHSARNWRPERYAAIAAHAVREHRMRVVLAGGPSEIERRMRDAILAATDVPVVDQVGKDTLPELLALLARATVLLSPDAGPAHMATMVGTPVIGLYAATNPQRSGPYYSRHWCVDRYDAAARRYRGRPAAELPWTTKIEPPGVMDLIEVEAVRERLDSLLAAGAARTPA